MASIDYSEPKAPRSDWLGMGLFLFHMVVGIFVIGGWLLPFAPALAFYLVLLPMIALQWLFNRGSCVLNNFETWLRVGRWRDASNPEEGRFLLMLSYWMFGLRPSRARIDALCYGAVLALWLLGLAHLTLLQAPQLLAGLQS